MKFQWAKDRDANSKLFHRVTSRRHRKSFIKELEVEDGSISRDNVVIASEISWFYCESFTEDFPFRPFVRLVSH